MLKVEEISRTYRFEGPPEPEEPTLGAAFEKVILTYFHEGYRLQSWRLSRVVIGHVLDETIVAVFERGGRNAFAD
jgi:hypothetical protein